MLRGRAPADDQVIKLLVEAGFDDESGFDDGEFWAAGTIECGKPFEDDVEDARVEDLVEADAFCGVGEGAGAGEVAIEPCRFPCIATGPTVTSPGETVTAGASLCSPATLRAPTTFPPNEVMIALTTIASIDQAAKRRNQPAQSRGPTWISPGAASTGGSSLRSRRNHCSAWANAADVVNRRNDAIRRVAYGSLLSDSPHRNTESA